MNTSTELACWNVRVRRPPQLHMDLLDLLVLDKGEMELHRALHAAPGDIHLPWDVENYAVGHVSRQEIQCPVVPGLYGRSQWPYVGK